MEPRLTREKVHELRELAASNPQVDQLPVIDMLITELDAVSRDWHEVTIEAEELKVHQEHADEAGFPVERAINVAEALRIVLEALRHGEAVKLGFPEQVLEHATEKLGEYDLKIDTNLPE